MATRPPLNRAEQQYIQTRKQAGASLRVIASELQCSHAAVRKWWRSLRKEQPRHGCGRPRRGILSTYPAALVEQAVALKREHPHWGPANVKVELRRQAAFQTTRLPCDSRLSALFKAVCPEAVQPRHRQQYPGQPPPAVRRPHQRWQIDGKEKVAVGEHEVATILNVRDPAGALMIESRAVLTTTEKGWRKVTLTEVQETLRTAFTHWGMPLEIQSDHEEVYTGAPGTDFPSRFTLWLTGLGLQHSPSRKHRPTDQAQVERSHRTLGDMAWKDELFDRVERLQARLDGCRQRYNRELPVHAADCQGRPPLEAHPQAQHSGRPFHRVLEWELFDLARVDAYLAARVWTRQISASGNVSIGNHLYYVGRTHLNQPVSVRFVPATRSFCFQLADGTPVAERLAVGFDKVDLIGYMPMEEAISITLQLSLPLVGV